MFYRDDFGHSAVVAETRQGAGVSWEAVAIVQYLTDHNERSVKKAALGVSSVPVVIQVGKAPELLSLGWDLWAGLQPLGELSAQSNTGHIWKLTGENYLRKRFLK